MTNQHMLFDVNREELTPETRARSTDPETSHQAAAKVNVSRSQALVLKVLQERSGTPQTANMIWLRLRHATTPERVRGALRELQDCEPPLVVVVGRRENEGGNMAQTYRERRNQNNAGK